ncbi:hypothetical protein [Marinibactrum halimedae]|uniref:Uncharacterized protein n=1 Tax=Marinibactrum halimedae TaxID=1444977 RepID=A0AA37T4C5_9GAMM|nr:hypothetical protein [Marinibactrum halimedae]MCD9458792.1 hypothetical protein [Marinibactrum halimedae]GLS25351.1 hypothetical protein GCM10007877_10650 [Marinibactrum halimedae]
MFSNIFNESFNNYLYLSGKTTRGAQGKTVYINPNLLQVFVEYSHSAGNYDILMTEKALNMLPSSYTGSGTSDNLTTPHVHNDTCGDFEVFYVIFQEKNENNHGSGLYITNIKRIAHRDAKYTQGLYHAEDMGGKGWEVNKSTSKKIEQPFGVIGAEYDRKNHRFSIHETMKAAEPVLEKSKTAATYKAEASIYYCPTYMEDQDGVWLDKELKSNGLTKGPQELAQILVSTQNQVDEDEKEPIYHWFVIGKGAEVLDKALNMLPNYGGAKLKNTKFHLVSPEFNVGLLFKKIDSVGAHVDKGVNSIKAKPQSYIYQISDIPTIGKYLESSNLLPEKDETYLKGQMGFYGGVKENLTKYTKDKSLMEEKTFMSLAHMIEERSKW